MKVKSESRSVMSDSLLPPWAIQSMEFSRPEYWSRYTFSSLGDLPNPGIEPRSPALQAYSLPFEITEILSKRHYSRPTNTGAVLAPAAAS